MADAALGENGLLGTINLYRAEEVVEAASFTTSCFWPSLF